MKRLFLLICLALGGCRDDLSKTFENVMLGAMARGYECHRAGRSLDDCQNEQRDRWRRVADGEKSLPSFGKEVAR